jgi:hypothetical protein
MRSAMLREPTAESPAERVGYLSKDLPLGFSADFNAAESLAH